MAVPRKVPRIAMTRLFNNLSSLALAGFLLASTCQVALPCTLFAAAGGRVEGGGALIVKNRDRKPQRSEVRFITPKAGYRFVGLIAVDSRYREVSAGVNEKGLVMVNAAASVLSSKERKIGARGLTEKILASCADVNAVLARKEMFTAAHPVFHLLADARQIALIEVAPQGRISVKVSDRGVLYHTNHYLDDTLLWANRKPNESSNIRLNRIRQLLTGHPAPFTAQDFLTFSLDRLDGPDNGIWRTGSAPAKIRTIAAWMVANPQGDAPRLHIKLANPGEPERTYDIKLDPAFWVKGVI